MKKPKVGLFSVGLDTYWDQFEGLLARLQENNEYISKRIDMLGGYVFNAGMIDNVEKAISASEYFKQNDVSIVFVHVSTYALSSTVLPAIRDIHVPIIILNLQPVPAIDYDSFNKISDRGKMTGEWLAHCQACSIPEIANVFNRSDIPYEIVTGFLNEPSVWNEIDEWIDATNVNRIMRSNNLGILGHYYNGMLDVYSNLSKQSITFGTNIEILEMCELKKFRDEATSDEIKAKLSEFSREFNVSEECTHEELIRAAKTSIALDKLVHRYNLGSLAYYYEGTSGSEYEDIVTSVIPGNTLLTGRHIPVAGEYEVKNAQAMKIMDSFESGGSFSEFYAMDFHDDVVLLGHDGPAHFKIAEGKVGLVPLPIYHGKPGKGLSIQMTVKHGPVTLLSVVDGKDGIVLLTAEGESVDGPVLNIGNTNSRYKFPINIKQFINSWSKCGPSHHCAVGVGHIGSKIEKLGFLLNTAVKKIC